MSNINDEIINLCDSCNENMKIKMMSYYSLYESLKRSNREINIKSIEQIHAESENELNNLLDNYFTESKINELDTDNIITKLKDFINTFLEELSLIIEKSIKKLNDLECKQN